MTASDDSPQTFVHVPVAAYEQLQEQLADRAQTIRAQLARIRRLEAGHIVDRLDAHLRVVRILVYTYPTEERMAEDMGRWTIPAGSEPFTAGSNGPTIESLVVYGGQVNPGDETVVAR